MLQTLAAGPHHLYAAIVEATPESIALDHIWERSCRLLLVGRGEPDAVAALAKDLESSPHASGVDASISDGGFRLTAKVRY